MYLWGSGSGVLKMQPWKGVTPPGRQLWTRAPPRPLGGLPAHQPSPQPGRAFISRPVHKSPSSNFPVPPHSYTPAPVIRTTFTDSPPRTPARTMPSLHTLRTSQISSNKVAIHNGVRTAHPTSGPPPSLTSCQTPHLSISCLNRSCTIHLAAFPRAQLYVHCRGVAMHERSSWAFLTQVHEQTWTLETVTMVCSTPRERELCLRI
jgi:hypothetical protein